MQLIVRIRSSTRSAEGRGVTAEGMANEQNYYLDGWVDAVLTLSPDRLPQLRRSMEEAMCWLVAYVQSDVLSVIAFDDHEGFSSPAIVASGGFYGRAPAVEVGRNVYLPLGGLWLLRVCGGA